jgi:RsiW-degrading membrane proteinase PrsW (M82 family)
VRSFLIRALPALAALIVGIVISVVGESSTVWFVIGMAMVGLSAVALASLFFYEVGRSEDRERERRGIP